jgi:membrane associated rhomboid family serine protease
MFSGKKKLVMCQVCRGLIEASARECPLCGRKSVPPARISTANLTSSGNFFTLVILTINIALFVLMAVVAVRSGSGGEAFVQSPSNGVLDDFGALVPTLARAGQWWRLVTFNFLHIGLMHLMFNSSALFSIGPQVEGIFGSQKFVFAYVATGVGSGVASLLFLPGGTAGASGAIFGLIGLMAVYGYRLGGSLGHGLMRQMLIWAAFGIMFGFFIGANNVAHVGGFVAGGALGFVLAPDAPSTAGSAARWNTAAIGCIGLVAISFVMAGRGYGSEQDKQREREVNTRRSQGVVEFAKTVEAVSDTIDDSFAVSVQAAGDHRAEAAGIAIALHRAAGEIEKAIVIDERTTSIKTRLIELINKRSKAFDEAGNDAAIAAAASADREAFEAVFKDFSDWENIALEDFKRMFPR